LGSNGPRLQPGPQSAPEVFTKLHHGTVAAERPQRTCADHAIVPVAMQCRYGVVRRSKFALTEMENT
jgi:hypothetical protein